MANEWYRNKKWNNAIKHDFFEHIKRCKTDYNKSQYLRIQAEELKDVDSKVSEELLEELFSKYPIDTQLAAAFWLKANICLKTNRKKEAVAYFRKVFEQQEIMPNVLTNAHLDFAVFVTIEEKTELYDEAEKILLKYQNGNHFPINQYQSFGSLAIIYKYKKKDIEAIECAKQCIANKNKTESPFRYHKKIGLVINPEKIFLKKIEKILS